MKNKGLVIVSVILFIMVLALGGYIAYKELSEDKCLPTPVTDIKEEVKEKEVIVYDVKDEYLNRFIFGPPLIALDNELNILSVLFGTKEEVKLEDLTAKQKFYLTLQYYVSIKDIELSSDEKHFVKINEFKSLLFEDASYFDEIEKVTEEKYLGEFSYLFKEDELYFGLGIFGVEGPGSYYDMETISAYQEGDKFYYNCYFYYYDYITMDEHGNADYDRYDGYKNTKIDSITSEDIAYYPPDYTKLSKYTFEYKIVGEKYYLERVTRK